MEIKDILTQHILPNVFRPVRYVGGEFNSAEMKENAVNFAFAFPDTYEVGMSHLGMKILYGLINEQPNVNCERVFAPMPDMTQQLRKYDVPLYTLETYRPLYAFDFVGFSLQYEMCLTNVLYMLSLGRIPLTAKERGEKDPIVIAGGPCTVNPEPFCDIFDLIVIGEAEEILPKLFEIYEDARDRNDFLQKACRVEGVYVPSFYEVEHDEKTGKYIRHSSADAPAKIRRAFIKDMNTSYYPQKVIVPYTEPVHDRIMLEVMRGCPRGCRFCQAGFIYRPVRQKSIETVKKQVDLQIESTGYEQVSLASLSTTDYYGCEEALKYIVEKYRDDRVSVSLPSLRIDHFSVNIVKQIQKSKKGTLTFAPEAGTQKMRDVINKNITEDDILGTLQTAFSEGFTKIKLYFMIGLPHETDEDVEGIGKLIDKILRLYDSMHLKPKLNLHASVSCFVPKPFTPFEFFGQNSEEEFERKQAILQKSISRRVKLGYHASSLSVLEAAFARGDRRLNRVLLRAFENGCYFDSWPDYYNMEGWEEAFRHEGLDFRELARKTFTYEEDLAWDFVDIGVSHDFFVREFEKAKLPQTTPNCYEKCSLCGISKQNGPCDFGLKKEEV